MVRLTRVYPRTFGTVAVLLAFAACVPAQVATPLPIDLLRELPRARLSPTSDNRVISVQVVRQDGVQKPALVMRGRSRVIWQVQMTEPAELRTDLTRLPGGDPDASISVRIGMSDERLYEDYFREPLPAPAGEAAEWRPLSIDLSLYSGWKWSIFYQPSRRAWSLVLNVEGGDASVALVEPRIIPRSQASRRRP